MDARRFPGGPTRRQLLPAFVLALVMLMGVGVPAAKADQAAMACGGSTEYLYYSSLNFYLPYDNSYLQFAFRVGNGDWDYTDWYFSNSDRSMWRWTGTTWMFGDNRLSYAQAQGEHVVAYVRYWDGYDTTGWFYLDECGGGETWLVGDYAGY